LFVSYLLVNSVPRELSVIYPEYQMYIIVSDMY